MSSPDLDPDHTLDPRTRLTLMVMRVDSPEFRALMRTSPMKGSSAPGAI